MAEPISIPFATSLSRQYGIYFGRHRIVTTTDVITRPAPLPPFGRVTFIGRIGSVGDWYPGPEHTNAD